MAGLPNMHSKAVISWDAPSSTRSTEAAPLRLQRCGIWRIAAPPARRYNRGFDVTQGYQMQATSGRSARPERPLSPHIQIYYPLINMVMSIVHRITGAALYIGSLLLAWWLIAAATGPDYYNYVVSWFATWPGKLILLGYTWALMHHMLGGIRHLIWDTGLGFDLKTIDILSWGSLAGSLVLTVLIWFCALNLGGI
jgi:succinate dehydrogenase / fumarate reductase cytochrome b subunit